MTPSNQPVDKETSAVMKAMGITSKPDETSNGNGADPNTQNTANNSHQQQNQPAADPEKNKSKSTKVFKVEKPAPVKDKVQNPANQQQGADPNAIKPEVYEKYLNETFGSDSVKLKEKLGRATELEELMKKSPYLTTQGQVLDELLSKKVSPETALKYINADKAKMSHKEIMALAMHVENPDIAIDTINDYLDQTYKLGNYAEKDGEGKPLEKPGLTRLEVDVQKHLKQFDTLKEKMVSNDTNRNSLAAKQKEVERVKGWEKPITDLFQNFTKIEVESPSGAKLEYSVEMDAEEKSELQAEFNDMVLRNPLQATEEGIADAKAILQARYITRHFDDIALAFMNQGRSISDNEWMEIVHNPSLPNGKGPVGQRGQGRDQALADMIIAAEGGKPRK